MQRITRVIAAVATALVVSAAGLVGGAAAPASAAGGTFTWSQSEVSAQFTEYWAARATFSDPNWVYAPCSSGCGVAARLDGPVAFTWSTLMYNGAAQGTAEATVSPFWADNLPGVLPPGDYTVTLTFTDYLGAQTVSPALPVTITPAELAFGLTTAADPAVPTALIASVTLTIDIESYYIGITPGGTWTLRGVDESGAEVLSREITPQTDGYRLWGSTYWADPPPGAKVTLTIDATGVDSEYEVSPASTTLTTVSPVTPPSTPEPTPPPDEVAASTGAALPMWVILLSGLVLVASLVTIVVVIVRRRRPTSPEEGDAPDATPETADAPQEGSDR